MIAKILGGIWILLGTLWLIWPNMLRKRFSKKMSRRMRRVVFFFMLVFGFMMIGSVIKAPGLTPKIVGVLGMIIAIKAIMLITSKTSEKFTEWVGQRSLLFFRIWALVIFVFGILMVLA